MIQVEIYTTTKRVCTTKSDKELSYQCHSGNINKKIPQADTVALKII